MIALIAAAAMIASPALAQGVDWGSIIHTEAMNSAIEEAAREGAGDARLTARQSSPSVTSALSQGFVAQTAPDADVPAPAAVSARYKPSPQVRQKLAGIMGDAAAKQGQAQGEEMRQLVLSGKALAEYQRIAPAFGLRANDAIDAFTFYMLAQWGVANDYRADFSRAEVAGVRQQAANAYAGVAGQLATDALRQEFAEMLVVQGAILSGAHEAAVRAGDDAATATYAALARQGGRTIFTMDPTTMELTDEGFKQKR
jgi:hypothetical protein